jgi:hypothetical protein
MLEIRNHSRRLDLPDGAGLLDRRGRPWVIG